MMFCGVNVWEQKDIKKGPTYQMWLFWVTFNGTYHFFNIQDRKFYSNLILSVYVYKIPS